MATPRSAGDRYRQDAIRFRQRAAVISDDRLRDSYIGLAREYERLAELLDPADHGPIREDEPRSRVARPFPLGKLLIQIVRALLGDRRGLFRTCRSQMNWPKPSFRR